MQRESWIRQPSRWAPAMVALAALTSSACSAPAESATEVNHAAVIEAIEGSELSQVTLSARAAERLAIETQAITAGAKMSVPYGAVLYDAHGETWVYTQTKKLNFVREPITVDRIDGDTAHLTAGPTAGTLVVTVGAAELFGAEMDVGH
ncbi:MAG: hypothetical protein ACRDO1_18390 [Nocardioidaceae bacterium]